MKKRIIFFSHSLCIGGIENALVNLLNHINYDKYDVTLVLEKKEGDFLSKINSNVNLYEYKLSYSKNILYRKIYNFIKRTIWSIKNKNKYDFSCCYATYSLMGSKLAKLASTNSSIYVHSDYSNLYNCDDYKLFFDNREIGKFRKIIFVSNESRKYFIKLYPNLKDKCITINNYIDSDKVISLSNEKINDIKRTKKILFTFVGRLDESSKKITRLLNLIKNISNEYDVELWIIGDGPDRKMYEKYVDDNKLNNVHILGKRSNPYPYMKEADYVILTSEYEGFPVVYLESILLNKDIITTIETSDEYMDIKDYGHIISKDVDIMTKEVKEILKKRRSKHVKLDFADMNASKTKILEKIFDDKI